MLFIIDKFEYGCPNENLTNFPFHFTLKVRRQCGTCAHVTENDCPGHENILRLCMNDTHPNRVGVQDLWIDHFQETELNYTCEKCKKQVPTKELISIQQFPIVLCIHINRIQLDQSLLSTPVTIPYELKPRGMPVAKKYVLEGMIYQEYEQEGSENFGHFYT